MTKASRHLCHRSYRSRLAHLGQSHNVHTVAEGRQDYRGAFGAPHQSEEKMELRSGQAGTHRRSAVFDCAICEFSSSAEALRSP